MYLEAADIIQPAAADVKMQFLHLSAATQLLGIQNFIFRKGQNKLNCIWTAWDVILQQFHPQTRFLFGTIEVGKLNDAGADVIIPFEAADDNLLACWPPQTSR